MSLQPLDDRIVVRPSEAEERTASGLVIPDTAKEKPQQGEVLAVGPGRRADNTGEIIPLDVAVGEKVVYSKYGGTEKGIPAGQAMKDARSALHEIRRLSSARPRRPEQLGGGGGGSDGFRVGLKPWASLATMSWHSGSAVARGARSRYR